MGLNDRGSFAGTKLVLFAYLLLRQRQSYAVGTGSHFLGRDTNHSKSNKFRDYHCSSDGNLPYDLCRVLQTLCEIQAAMLERGVPQHENITRQIMGNELRHIGNSSYRNVRDWIIFRDCMNGLEYVIQVFEYFKQKLVTP